MYIRETDQSWIYGLYTCRARNFLGIAESNILLKRACECLFYLIINRQTDFHFEHSVTFPGVVDFLCDQQASTASPVVVYAEPIPDTSWTFCRQNSSLTRWQDFNSVDKCQPNDCQRIVLSMNRLSANWFVSAKRPVTYHTGQDKFSVLLSCTNNQTLTRVIRQMAVLSATDDEPHCGVISTDHDQTC